MISYFSHHVDENDEIQCTRRVHQDGREYFVLRIGKRTTLFADANQLDAIAFHCDAALKDSQNKVIEDAKEINEAKKILMQWADEQLNGVELFDADE